MCECSHTAHTHHKGEGYCQKANCHCERFVKE